MEWLAEMLAIFTVFMELLLYKMEWKIAEDIECLNKKITFRIENNRFTKTDILLLW